MTISFDNQQVRKVCEIEEVAIETLGYDKSIHLKSKLSDLDACDSLKKYKAIFRDMILENETYIIKTRYIEIIFKVVPASLKKVDLSKIRRIKIIKVS